MSYTTVQDTARLSVMNFLSEIKLDFPDAISFASGQPADAFFDFDGWIQSIERFQRHLAARAGKTTASIGRTLAQYGRTNGLINDLVSEQIRKDDGVVCPPERIILTSGCQEALMLCLKALCPNEDDVAISRNPTYIGITGAADHAGIELVPLKERVDTNVAASLRDTIASLLELGKRPRVLYLIPEFDNPTGTVLSIPDREAILATCAEFEIVILEDNPYGMFRFEGTSRPTLASLDQHGLVIYLGTYSKTLCPAIRVGCAVLPETLFGAASASRALAAEIGERKSFSTINTSQINQALVGGILLAEECSLDRLVRPALDFYRLNRDTLVENLAMHFSGQSHEVSWNQPEGGFFLSLSLPFTFGKDEMITCASEHKVIPMPMSFFSLDGSQQDSVRLSFSNVTPSEIAVGVERFAGYVHDRLAKM